MAIEKIPGELTQAERTRRITAAAAKSAVARQAERVRTTEVAIAKKAKEQKTLIDAAIKKAAEEGRHQAAYTYSERITASRNSAEEVSTVKDFADNVSKTVATELEADGYQVGVEAKEVLDYRQSAGSPPEYYDTTFKVTWETT